mmetsp:Transcript_40497/g.81712  ORF Transcript_40497/g.81712 Transcript_40497/m.81712 type:complete len:280 (+) Transcript_40497:126-965(+)
MSSQPKLCELRRFPLGGGRGDLILASGSVLDFQGGACVNAANEGCVGGFGVDELVNKSGGAALRVARKALGGCPTGQAKFTESFGHTNTQIIVHAVGPVYRLNAFKDGPIAIASDAEQQAYLQTTKDPLLSQAYANALRVACEALWIRKILHDDEKNGDKYDGVGGGGGGGAYRNSTSNDDVQNNISIGCCLLSAGVFRGNRGLDAVCRVAVEAIMRFFAPGGGEKATCHSLLHHHHHHPSSSPSSPSFIIGDSRRYQRFCRAFTHTPPCFLPHIPNLG